jgi:hypothetical protein
LTSSGCPSVNSTTCKSQVIGAEGSCGVTIVEQRRCKRKEEEGEGKDRKRETDLAPHCTQGVE